MAEIHTELGQYEHFVHELLKLGKGIEDILNAVKIFPKNPKILLCTAILFLYGQTAVAQNLSKHYLRKASALDTLDAQEKSLLEALNHWAHLHIEKTMELLETHCHKYPSDLLAIKVLEFLYYCNGQQYNSKRFLKTTLHCLPYHAQNGYFLAIHSFAQELSGDIPGAKSTAEKALQLAQDNPWAHHTLSHVYLNSGEIEPGIKVLETFSTLWPSCNRMIESHNFWHLSLMYYENLQFDKVQEVIDRADWKTNASLVGVEVDAAALLWRLDMEQDCAELWKGLAKDINGHAAFAVIPFVSVQLMYALKKAGELDVLEAALKRTYHYVDTLHGPDKTTWTQAGLPLIEGCLAFAEGNAKAAADRLGSILKVIPSVGGSDAQVDLFYITYLRALLDSGQKIEAGNFLKHLAKGRQLTARERQWMS